MSNELFCRKLALERVQFQIAQLSALVLANEPAELFSCTSRKSLKTLLTAMESDVRLILDLLPQPVPIQQDMHGCGGDDSETRSACA